jgi:hypothetical protein
MYCPKCHVEYVPGFTRCADCDVELVEVLPAAKSARRGSNDDLVTVFTSHDPGLVAIAESRTPAPCPSICRSWPATPMRHAVSWPSSQRLSLNRSGRHNNGINPIRFAHGLSRRPGEDRLTAPSGCCRMGISCSSHGRDRCGNRMTGVSAPHGRTASLL